MAWPTEAGSVASGVAVSAAVPTATGIICVKPIQWRHSLTYEVIRHGNIVTITATSNLGPSGYVWYHWFLDGSFLSSTNSNVYSVFLQADEQARIDVLDSLDADYDAVRNAPEGYSARRTIFWYRSFDDDISYYRVDQNKASGGWSEIGRVPHSDSVWTYSLFSPRLDDLTAYEWRVVPVDLAGNDGTSTDFPAKTIVRTPDSPDFEIAYDEDTDKITFS